MLARWFCVSRKGGTGGGEWCHLQGAVHMVAARLGNSADYYLLVNEWVWSKSRDCLLRPEVDMGAVLESEVGQKWR